MFDKVHHRLGFFRSKAVIRAQAFDDGAGFLRRQFQAVQANHPLDGLLPAFGRGTLPGNPRHVAFFVALMAAAALGDNQRIGNRNAFFHHRLRICRSAATAATAALRLEEHRKSQKKECEQSHISRLDYDSAFSNWS